MRNLAVSSPLVPIVTALVLAVMTQVVAAQDYGKKEAKAMPASSGAMGRTEFLVISPHTPEQCLAALDAIAAAPEAPAELAQWEWGCMAGDHTGYRIVAASSAEEALKVVPATERSTAKAIKLNKFTVEQIKSFHSMKKQ